MQCNLGINCTSKVCNFTRRSRVKLLTLRVYLIPKLHCKPCYHKLIVCSFKLEPRVELIGERRGNSRAVFRSSLTMIQKRRACELVLRVFAATCCVTNSTIENRRPYFPPHRGWIEYSLGLEQYKLGGVSFEPCRRSIHVIR